MLRWVSPFNMSDNNYHATETVGMFYRKKRNHLEKTVIKSRQGPFSRNTRNGQWNGKKVGVESNNFQHDTFTRYRDMKNGCVCAHRDVTRLAVPNIWKKGCAREHV